MLKSKHSVAAGKYSGNRARASLSYSGSKPKSKSKASLSTFISKLLSPLSMGNVSIKIVLFAIAVRWKSNRNRFMPKKAGKPTITSTSDLHNLSITKLLLESQGLVIHEQAW